MSTDMTPVEVLRKARELVSDPAHWCQGYFRCGEAYCSAGALLYTTRDEWLEDKAYGFMLAATGQSHSISGWNDDENRTHAEVIAAFDRAIALAETSPS